MPIPIQNIYYLLCYAWNKLDEAENRRLEAIDPTDLINLLARVFINGTTTLFKEGLDRSYLETEASIYGLKGKLACSETIKKHLLPFGKTVCIYDEFSYNILHNQILKSTFRYLIKTDNLAPALKTQCLNLFRRFPEVDEVALAPARYKAIRLHRNNRHYSLLLSISQLIIEQLLPNEKTGTYWFKDFIRDEKKMAFLFESFIRNFCYHHFPQHKVYREDIHWQVDTDPATKRLLPKMQTDISIASTDRKLIIDTKFYAEALREHFDAHKFQEANLYQLFAYLKNIEAKGPLSKICSGLLLYPTTTQHLNASLQMEGHTLHIKTINLNQHWKNIEKELVNIIKSSF